MGFFNGWKGESDDEMPAEEYVEVDLESADGRASAGKISIAIEKLTDFGDTDRILRAVRAGSLVFLKIKHLKEKDLGELKRSVEKIKKTVHAQNGEIVGVEQDWLVLAPHFAKVDH